ncbi:MAG: hypothetical protein ACRC8S_11220 [Fimbriiglobus sp.]
MAIRRNWCGDLRMLLPNPLTKVEHTPIIVPNTSPTQSAANAARPPQKPG